MIYFAYLLFGGLAGFALWLYITSFMPRLKADVWQNYQELFPEWATQMPVSKDETVPALRRYLFFDGGLMLILGMMDFPPFSLLWLYAIINLLFAISLLDWQYRLISPNLCLWLFFLGLLGAQWQITPLLLSESLESALLYFGCFYLLYQSARMLFRQEALGQGDYWLALGLGAYLPLKQLPMFLLCASLFGICSFFISRQTHIPFAPAMCLAMICLQIGYF